jgi:hypothetical protein
MRKYASQTRILHARRDPSRIFKLTIHLLSTKIIHC